MLCQTTDGKKGSLSFRLLGSFYLSVIVWCVGRVRGRGVHCSNLCRFLLSIMYCFRKVKFVLCDLHRQEA